jgi:hypothetical protein
MKKLNSKSKKKSLNRNKRKIVLEARRKAKRKILRLREEKMEKALKKARNSRPEETLVL